MTVYRHFGRRAWFEIIRVWFWGRGIWDWKPAYFHGWEFWEQVDDLSRVTHDEFGRQGCNGFDLRVGPLWVRLWIRRGLLTP